MANPVENTKIEVKCPYCGDKAKARSVEDRRVKLKSHIENKHPDKLG